MRKIVVLNSGGFDSTVLLLQTIMENPDCEIHSLYFDYKQPNRKWDSKISKENAHKVGAIHHSIDIPALSWSKGNFYNPKSNQYITQYLEMRNMIFISYAISLAESIGAESIKMAILKSHGYTDTSTDFINCIKEICKLVNIDFEAPFMDLDKFDIYGLAKILKIGTEYSFISCDTPDENGNPCGKCADCTCINEYLQILNDDTPIKAFFTSGLDTKDQKFRELFLNEPVTELRVLINNDCQLNCSHCYHSGNSLVGEKLTNDEMKSALKEAYDYGIREFHFSGKEPLYDDRIFVFTEYLKTLSGVTYHVVTNGINVPKYAERLKLSGISKVFLSVEDEYGFSNIRSSNTNKCIKRAVESLNSAGIPVEIFYDLTPDNIEHTLDNIYFWIQNYDVRSFYIRTIRNIGNANNGKFTLSNESLYKLHKQLRGFSIDGVSIVLNIGACPYTYNILFDNNDSELKTDIGVCCTYGFNNITKNYSLFAEMYCGKYENRITLMPDGYILGCAMECSVSRYDYVSAGNIKTEKLSEIIRKGKRFVGLNTNDYQTRDGKIFFKKCSFNPIDLYI